MANFPVFANAFANRRPIAEDRGEPGYNLPFISKPD
jgi:hypothetical protein